MAASYGKSVGLLRFWLISNIPEGSRTKFLLFFKRKDVFIVCKSLLSHCDCTECQMRGKKRDRFTDALVFCYGKFPWYKSIFSNNNRVTVAVTSVEVNLTSLVAFYCKRRKKAPRFIVEIVFELLDLQESLRCF